MERGHEGLDDFGEGDGDAEGGNADDGADEVGEVRWSMGTYMAVLEKALSMPLTLGSFMVLD